MLDEAAGVGTLARFAAEPVLQRSERADPTGKLDRGSPDRRRDVKIRHPWPSQHQQPTQHYEHHEEKVNAYDEIGENSG